TVEHDSGCPNVVVTKKPKVVILLDWKLGRRLEQGTVWQDDSHEAICKPAGWTLFERSNGGLQRRRQQPVVSVEKEEKRSSALPVPSIARRRRPLVLLVKVSNPPEGLGDPPGVILRSVIHEHDLQRTVALVQNTRDRFTEISSLVVAGNDHRDERCCA